MRWPLRLQLLVPVLMVVMTAIVGSSLLSAYLVADWVQRRQEENLARAVKTLTDASFPLTEQVLHKMTGLSGAEFIVLDPAGQTQAASRRFAADELATIGKLALQKKGALDLSAGGVVTLGGARYLAARVPVLVAAPDESPISTLVVLYPEEQWSAAWWQAVYPALAVGAVALALAAVVTTLLARRVVGPLELLRRRAAAIEQGDFQPMPLGRRDDEIQDLARSINHMVGKLAQYEADVRHNERLRTLGQLGAGLAHQLRNAATGARLALDLHRRRCPIAQSESAGSASEIDSEVQTEALEVAARQLALMETYLQRFLTLGRRGPPQRLPLDLGAVVDDVLPLIRPACEHAKITLQWTRPVGLPQVEGDAQALTQMLVNLLLNAVEAASSKWTASQGETKEKVNLPRRDAPLETRNGMNSVLPSRVQIEVVCDDQQRVVCRVSDTGPGPAAVLAERVFEPFVTDKPDGTGLGLSVVRQIAEEHGAQLSWQRVGQMTEFCVSFPALQ